MIAFWPFSFPLILILDLQNSEYLLTSDIGYSAGTQPPVTSRGLDASLIIAV